MKNIRLTYLTYIMVVVLLSTYNALSENTIDIDSVLEQNDIIEVTFRIEKDPLQNGQYDQELWSRICTTIADCLEDCSQLMPNETPRACEIIMKSLEQCITMCHEKNNDTIKDSISFIIRPHSISMDDLP